MSDRKIVVITGGSGYLGKFFAKEIARSGDIAIIADINIDKAIADAEEITKSYPASCFAYELDITKKSSIESLINNVNLSHGKIDVLVNNAYPRNSNYGNKLEDVSYVDFCENVNMHLGGYFQVMQTFSKFFKSQGKGNIINMSSIYGFVAPKFEIYDETEMTMPVEYAAIKAAILNLTKYFASYYKGSSIRFNSLSPGGILDAQPQSFVKAYNENCFSKGMLDPIDIANTLLFLISEKSSYMNGQNIIVDDGFSL